MEPVVIPRLIDEPPNVLMWTTFELVPIMFGLVGGIIAGQVLILGGLGFATTWSFKRFQDARPDGYLLHLLYWVGVEIRWPSPRITVPNPFATHFLP